MNDCVVLEIGNESSVYLIMMRNLFAMILLSDMIEKNELLTDEHMFDIMISGSLPEVINVKQRQI